MSVGIQTPDLINSLVDLAALKMPMEASAEIDISFQEVLNSQPAEIEQNLPSEFLGVSQLSRLPENISLKEDVKKDSLDRHQNPTTKKNNVLEKSNVDFKIDNFFKTEDDLNASDKPSLKRIKEDRQSEEPPTLSQKHVELELPKPFPGNTCGIPLTPIVDTPSQAQINFPDQKKQGRIDSFQLESTKAEELQDPNLIKEKMEKNSPETKTRFQKKSFMKVEKTSEPINFQRPQIVEKSEFTHQFQEKDGDLNLNLKEQDVKFTSLPIHNKSTTADSFKATLHSKETVSVDPTAVLNPIRRQLNETVLNGGISKAGETHVKVRLYPEELGTVDIRVDISKDGTSKVLFTAENQAVKEVLARYSQDVIQIFDQSGLFLESDGLNFSMRQDNPQNQFQQQMETSFIEPVVDEEAFINNPFARSNSVSSGRVDIHV